MNLSGARVLITGGAGFIGSHITERLLEMGANVVVYDKFDKYYEGKEANLTRASASSAFKLVRGDILDSSTLDSALAGVDVVIHEAGQAGVGYSVQDPLNTNNVNVVGTLNVLWLSKTHSVKRVVNVSSSSIFGKPLYLPIDEDHPKNPASPYGVSKLAAEQYARVFHDVYGTDAVSLRYFSVYGPRGRPDQVIRRFMQNVSEGKPPVINGDGAHTRDFTHVSDVVSATISAASTDDIGGEAFNIGFGERTSILGVANKVIDLMGRPEIHPVHAAESKGDFPDTQADNRKARTVLGWTPKVSLDEGLDEYVRWFTSLKPNRA